MPPRLRRRKIRDAHVHRPLCRGVRGQAREPSASLGTYFAAAQLPDILWPYFLLAGVEHVTIAPGDTAFTPLRFDSYPVKLGLGLWNSVLGTLGIESAMFVGGVWLYLSHTRARDGVGRYGLAALVALLAVIYVAAAFGPVAPSARAVALSAIPMPLLALWAAWADRHRV